ncbi:MAG: hypothetical protein R6U40_09995 [Desulfobacterales bacterium]
MEFGLARNKYIHCDFDYIDDNNLPSLFEEEDDEEEGIIKGLIKSIF